MYLDQVPEVNKPDMMTCVSEVDTKLKNVDIDLSSYDSVKIWGSLVEGIRLSLMDSPNIHGRLVVFFTKLSGVQSAKTWRQLQMWG